MPIYEYECTSCGHRYEKMVKMGADAPPCPSCASAEIRKLVSRSGFILQGGGWYKDHYGLKSGGDASDSSSKASASGTKSEGAKSEGAKSEGGKSEGGKSEGAKSDGGGKTESAPAAKTEAPKATESPKGSTKAAAAGS